MSSDNYPWNLLPKEVQARELEARAKNRKYLEELFSRIPEKQKFKHVAALKELVQSAEGDGETVG